MRIRLALLTAALLTSPAQISAQNPLAVGDRIRIGFWSNNAQAVGNLAGFTPDSIALQPPIGLVQSWAWSEVRRVDISLGIKNQAFAGGVLGSLGGAVLGLLYEGLDHAPLCIQGSQGRYCSTTDEPEDGHPVIFGAVAGALVGTLIGVMRKDERWDQIAVPLVADGSGSGTRFRIGIAVPF